MIPDFRCETDAGSAVTHLELEITQRCPLACTYCYRSRIERPPDRTMSFETARRAVDWFFRQAPEGRELSVWFMGGEPLAAFGRKGLCQQAGQETETCRKRRPNGLPN